MSYVGKEYLQSALDHNKLLLSKLNRNLESCNIQLAAVKLKVSALQLQLLAMKAVYQDIMELRKIITELNTHLKKTR